MESCEDGWRRAGVTGIRLSIQPIGAQWKLGKPNGTECRMLQCASPAEHTGTEVSTHCLLLLWLESRFWSPVFSYRGRFQFGSLGRFGQFCLFALIHPVEGDNTDQRQIGVTKVGPSNPHWAHAKASRFNLLFFKSNLCFFSHATLGCKCVMLACNTWMHTLCQLGWTTHTCTH